MALLTSPPMNATSPHDVLYNPFIDTALTFVFQILDEWIHFQAALLHITVDPPKASEPFILPLATSTSFRALRGEHFGAYPPIYLCVEEYIVGILFILFTLISAFLRRLHLPDHQAGELTSTLQPSIGVPVHGRILFPVYWSTVSLPHSG